MKTFAIHVCVWYTPVERDWGRTLLNYWPISIPSKIFCNNSPENICFSVLADQNDKKMAVIFGLYVSGAVSCDWLSVSRSANQKLFLAGQSEAAERRFWLQELYQELETQRGLSRGNTRTGSRKAYASMDITRWEPSCWAVRGKIWTEIRGA